MSRTSSMPLIDHEGRHFSRVKDMAAFWGLYPELLSARYRSGLSIKDCLTRPCRSQKNTREKSKGCFDHLGKWFSSQVERGRWWHKDANLVRARIRGGMSVERALTCPDRWIRLREKLIRQGIFSDTKKERKTVKEHAGISSRDHLGNTFISLAAMCRFWKKDPRIVWYRLEAGWSIKDALTKPFTPANQRNRTWCRDHLGRAFISQKEMARAWGVSIHTFRGRVKLGWSIEDALTKPPKLTGRPRKEKTA